MVCKTEGAVEHVLPDLYARTDGIWRLAYSRGGQLVHQAFDADGPVQEPLSLGRGTAPSYNFV